MSIKTRAPVFEFDHRELSPEALDEALDQMGSGDFLLVYESGKGYRALHAGEAERLRELCAKEGPGKWPREAPGEVDLMVHGERSEDELEAELVRLRPPRRRLIHVTEDGLKIAHEPEQPSRGPGGLPGGAFSISFDPGDLMPPGAKLPVESEALGVCPPLVPGSRPPGQPFLERQHVFGEIKGITSRICRKCGASCAHPKEQRLPGGRCGRCGALGLG